jgi:hypothetical protein
VVVVPWWGWLLLVVAGLVVGFVAGVLWFAWQFQKGMRAWW